MLSDTEVGYLYEIYELTFQQYTVVMGGEGQSRLQVDLFSAGKSIRDQLTYAIQQINQNPAWENRVRAIVTEFEGWALDPSPITQQGYEFRPERNLKTIRKRLYPYTGIIVDPGNGNRIPLG